MITFALWLHLAGVVCCAEHPTTFAAEAECREAGRRELAKIKHRSPNDWAECIRREIEK